MIREKNLRAKNVALIQECGEPNRKGNQISE
jgi:hypothetical protein